MEVERQRYSQTLTVNERGHATLGPDQRVGPTEKFEFMGPGDAVSMVVGGGFTSSWHPDFLQREMGKEGVCARFYFDKRIVLDIADPESDISKKKRKLLFRHGFGYLCIPPGFAKDEAKLRKLYNIALQEYFDYEKRHPRPIAIQESIVIDEKGFARRAFLTAIDIRVGGGITGNVTQQKAELAEAAKLSPKQVKQVKLHTKLHKKLRRAVQSGTPFRNPFVARNKRQFNIQYA